MLVKKDHIQNLIANDTQNRFKSLDNPEGYELWYDT